MLYMQACKLLPPEMLEDYYLSPVVEGDGERTPGVATRCTNPALLASVRSDGSRSTAPALLLPKTVCRSLDTPSSGLLLLGMCPERPVSVSFITALRAASLSSLDEFLLAISKSACNRPIRTDELRGLAVTAGDGGGSMFTGLSRSRSSGERRSIRQRGQDPATLSNQGSIQSVWKE